MRRFVADEVSECRRCPFDPPVWRSACRGGRARAAGIRDRRPQSPAPSASSCSTPPRSGRSRAGRARSPTSARKTAPSRCCGSGSEGTRPSTTPARSPAARGPEPSRCRSASPCGAGFERTRNRRLVSRRTERRPLMRRPRLRRALSSRSAHLRRVSRASPTGCSGAPVGGTRPARSRSRSRP